MRYEPDGEVLTEYFLNENLLSIIQGPIQSGTSTASCHRIWKFACDQWPDNDRVRRSRWIITRDTYKDLKETTIKTWLEWFPESEWGQLVRSEPSTHNLRHFINGRWRLPPHPSGDGTVVDCEVIFLALPDPDVAEKVLASYEITGFFRNEAQFCEKAVIDELLSRCARYPSKRNGPGARWFGGFLDLNAPAEGHWIPYMRGDIPIPADMPEDMRAAMKQPDGWVFYVQPPGLIEKKVGDQIVYEANPKAENQKHTRQNYLEMIKGKPRSWINQRVLNKVGVYQNGKPVHPLFMPLEHIALDPLEVYGSATLVVGLDFGRMPAAAMGQCINGKWRVLGEVIGRDESAALFAPRVKRYLAEKFPGMTYVFWGDPRGADRGQNEETTAYDIWARFGMKVMPATTDNNPEMRTSAMAAVLSRRSGMLVDPSCMTIKVGMSGGYHYPKMRGTGMFSDKPKKNIYSHVCEALENMILGGGEGDQLVRTERAKITASPVVKHKVKLRRLGR